MKLFGIDASRAFASAVARELGIELAAHEERDFEDSEFKIRPLESVRNEHVFVCQSLASDSRQSVNDKLLRLLVLVGALKDAGAGRITAVVPYLGYARKDRRTQARDPVTIRYVAQIFEAVGVDAIMTIDVHNLAAFDNAFRCTKEHLEAAPLFVDRLFVDHVVQHEVEHAAGSAGSNIVVMSPDVGGIKRARRFADLLEARLERSVELAFMQKHRSEGRVSGDLFAGDVAGATVIVVDDLISGGTTMARAARAAVDRGAAAVRAVATHGVFAETAADALGIAQIASIAVTDSIDGVERRCPELTSKLVVLPSASIVAERIRRLMVAPDL